jgi:hypothetical protein
MFCWENVATVWTINAQSKLEIAYFRFAVETNKARWVEIAAINLTFRKNTHSFR